MRTTAARIRGRLTVLFALLAVFSSCSLFWTQVEYIGSVVWSEDDTRVAYSWLSYDERTPLLPSDTTIKRNFRYGLFLAEPDGSDVVTVSDARAAIPGGWKVPGDRSRHGPSV